VSVLGPGYGESIVVHLGRGEWAIVDSCFDADQKPAPLAYLEDLGVNIERDVKIVVISHWDDDHINGISTVVARCESARLVIGTAYTEHDFLRAIFGFARTRLQPTNVKEFDRLQDVLEKHPREVRPATVDTRPWFRKQPGVPDSGEDKGIECEVWTLSPSGEDVTRAIVSVERAFRRMVKVGKSGYLSPVRPNASSVVLWIRIGSSCLLLGGDLDAPANDRRGWRAVVHFADSWRGRRAEVFKVPHHGSEGSHYEEVYRQMLLEKRGSLAVVTPFTRKLEPLPTSTGRALVCAGAQGIITSERRESGLAPDSAAVFRQAAVRFEVLRYATGFVRLRKPISGGSWNVQVSPDSVDLCTGEQHLS
jgi:Metallo-beta-lactamase superfamily